MLASINIAGNRRCSIYLNNVGCSLMKQGSFEDAMKTFNDAVFVVKHGVCSLSSRAMQESTNNSPKAAAAAAAAAVVVTNLELQAKMKRADQRLACPQVFDRKASGVSSAAVEEFVIVELDDFQLIDIDDLLCKQEQRQFVICPVFIDADLTCSAHVDTDGLLSGTMLYNLGLCHSCLAKNKLDPHHQQYCAAAARILYLADCVLRRVLTTDPATAHEMIQRDFALWKFGAVTAMAAVHCRFQHRFADSRCDPEGLVLATAREELYYWLVYLQGRIYMNKCWYTERFSQLLENNGTAPAA